MRRQLNAALVLVLFAVMTLLGLTLLFGLSPAISRFGPLHTDDLSLTFGAGILVLALLEFLRSRRLPGG